MNIQLLRKIQKHISEEPRRYTFHWRIPSSISPCGTQACIAGWAMVLSGKRTPESVLKFDWNSWDAAEVLGLSEDEKNRLFIHWPDKFSANLHDPATAVKRIDFFIETDGTDQPASK